MAKKKALIVLRDPETIDMMSDPMRKEIMRLLSKRSMTETELSELLGITKTSVSYHLKALKKAGMIKVQRTAIEEHGILQKFYEPTSVHFVVDFEKIPLMVKKHYLDVRMERLRGMLTLFQVVEKSRGRELVVTPDLLEELAEEQARSLAVVGARHEGEETDLERETYLTMLNAEAFIEVLRTEKWRKFFEQAGVLGEFIVKQLSNQLKMSLR
nr:helix-turn-helix domain-containing protein [Candidatus Njordarchaeota archaeon]